MAARVGRGFSVLPLTARLVVVALRHYADDLAAEIGAHAHPYQVRFWGSRGELVAELAVCNDLSAAGFRQIQCNGVVHPARSTQFIFIQSTDAASREMPSYSAGTQGRLAAPLAWLRRATKQQSFRFGAQER
jgi:hypothetical protein